MKLSPVTVPGEEEEGAIGAVLRASVVLAVF